MWNAGKEGHRRKFVALNGHVKKKSKINNLKSLCFKNLENDDQSKDKSSTEKEIKIRAEIDERENRKTLEKNQ